MQAPNRTMCGVSGVIETNDDAQASKLACVRLGYFRDDFVHHFVKTPVSRAPLINRGYYSRFAALRTLLLDFLKQTSSSDKRQIIVLGAGYDTTYFQITAEGILPTKKINSNTNNNSGSSGATPSTAYVELDFLDVTQRKSAAIQHIPALLQTLETDGEGNKDDKVEVDCERGEVTSSRYSLLPADLRDLDQVEAALTRAGIDYSVPTFILAECVLVYMHPQQSDTLLHWLGHRFSNSSGTAATAALVIYEQVNPNDAFGKQMMMNLSVRGCPLLGIVSSIEAHKERLKNAGWQKQEAKTMNEIYKSCLDPNDVRRIQKLEIFDEFEEWDLIQEHYCIAVAVNDTSENGILKIFGLHEAKDPRVAALEALLASKKKG